MAHKHAEFFNAIANGESLADWECNYVGRGGWANVAIYLREIAVDSSNWEVRRKPKTHVVNGFTVPAPLRAAPAEGVVYYYPVPSFKSLFSSPVWWNRVEDDILLKRGLIHLTKEAAIANAKAMCGIDPRRQNE